MKPSTSATPPKTANLTAKDLIRRVLTAALRLSIAARVPRRQFWFRQPLGILAGNSGSQPLKAGRFKFRSVHGLQGAIDRVA